MKRTGWAAFRAAMLALGAAAMMPLFGALAEWLHQAEVILAEHGSGFVNPASVAIPQLH